MNRFEKVKQILHNGTVIPATPLALHADRSFDSQRQAALCRYYLDCGVGGIATAVHTTQFEIRKPEYNLYRTVLKIMSDEIDTF
ncbi:MAG TPA: dihydrodipicolinate synthase family protein, partial [Clostridiales bacterium]|nr:dihydrodipicolinate synthase family protein [Clostridiales bacterium]